MTRPALTLFLLLTLGGCGQTSGKPPADPNAPEPTAAPAPRIGALMVETAHRFELAGRARVAGRWDLSAYEVGEIAELFELDVSRAYLPGACNDDVSEAMFSRLLDEQLPALKQAAEQHDQALFAERFREASVSCNACHSACEVGFIEVPDAPGQSIPNVDALATPATPRRTATAEAPATAEATAN